MFLHLSSSLQLASPPTSVVRTPASGVSARAVALCCFAGKLPLSLRAAKMFLHLSSSLQLASPPTSVVRTPASAVSARAVALCCFAGNFICSLRRKREEFSVQLCCQKNSVAVFLPCLRVKFCRAAQVHVLQRQRRQIYARRKMVRRFGCRAKYCIFRRRCMSWPAK